MSPLAVAACGDMPSNVRAEPTGTLKAALLTTGVDGTIYRFQPGATITLVKGAYTDAFPIDGSETLLNIDLPVGVFTVLLDFPDGTPRLVRSQGTETTVVDATWVDPQPVTVSISKDATTSLVLHFEVEGLGDVTFDMGRLAVAVDVQRTETTTPAELWESGTYTNTATLFGPSASPDAQSQLAMTPGEAHAHFFDFNLTGPWAQVSAEQVCATTAFDGFTTQDGDSGFSRAVNELISAPGIACIVDEGADDRFFVTTDRVGLPPFDQPYLPGTNYSFFLNVSGFVGDVYDRSTFQQSSLETFAVFTNGLIHHQIFDRTLNEEVVFSHGTLEGSVRLVP